MVLFMIAISIFFLAITIFAVAESVRNRCPEALAFSAIFVGLAVAVAGYVGVRSGRVLRCHEFGVSIAGWVGRRALRFDQLAVLTFSATKMRVEGIPVGTTFRLRLEPDAGADARAISFSGTLRKNDAQIETLRDLASRAIAQRMGRQLIASGRASWTRHLGLAAQGIEYRPLGFFGRKPPAVLPYDDVSNVHIHEGFFSVWRHGRKRAVIRASVSEPNFFPGYRLLLTVFEQRRKLAASGA
jgi:hypothetical protein